jgi:hypothetical protein
MFFKTYLLAGILSLAFFGYAQTHGMNLFEKTASAQSASGLHSGSGGRLSHK